MNKPQLLFFQVFGMIRLRIETSLPALLALAKFLYHIITLFFRL